jgi:hypothetical protein
VILLAESSSRAPNSNTWRQSQQTRRPLEERALQHAYGSLKPPPTTVTPSPSSPAPQNSLSAPGVSTRLMPTHGSDHDNTDVAVRHASELVGETSTTSNFVGQNRFSYPVGGSRVLNSAAADPIVSPVGDKAYVTHWKKQKQTILKTQRRAFASRRDNPFAEYDHDPNDRESALDVHARSVRQTPTSIIPDRALAALRQADRTPANMVRRNPSIPNTTRRTSRPVAIDAQDYQSQPQNHASLLQRTPSMHPPVLLSTMCPEPQYRPSESRAAAMWTGPYAWEVSNSPQAYDHAPPGLFNQYPYTGALAPVWGQNGATASGSPGDPAWAAGLGPTITSNHVAPADPAWASGLGPPVPSNNVPSHPFPLTTSARSSFWDPAAHPPAQQHQQWTNFS